MSFTLPLNGFENKSDQSRAHYLKPSKNSGPIPSLGGGGGALARHKV